MNKYEHHARKARTASKIDRMCRNKRRYDTEADAYQKNPRTYLCPHCKGWHRSGKFEELVRISKRK